MSFMTFRFAFGNPARQLHPDNMVSWMAVDTNAAFALQQLLSYAEPSLFGQIADFMQDIFSAMDGYDESHLTQYILILRGCLEAIQRWLPALNEVQLGDGDTVDDGDERPPAPPHVKLSEEVCEHLNS